MYETNTQDATELVKAGGKIGKFFIRNSDVKRMCTQYDNSLFKECIILRARYIPVRGAIEYIAINQKFQNIEPFQRIPVYQVNGGKLSYVATGL